MPLFKGWVLNYGPITEGFPSVFHDLGVLLGLRDSDCSPSQSLSGVVTNYS